LAVGAVEELLMTQFESYLEGLPLSVNNASELLRALQDGAHTPSP
jgi:hypothetical protein